MTSLVYGGGVPRYDVFLIAGQSNAVGNGSSIDPAIDTTHPRVWQWPSGQVGGDPILAVDPLDHQSTLPGKVGFPMTFSKLYLAQTGMPGARNVLLVPSAKDSTGLHGSVWAVDGACYDQAVADANEAMTWALGESSHSVFRGALWLQGETDAIAGVSQSDYATDLDALIAGFRSEITGATSSAFVVGRMVPEFRALTGLYPAVTGIDAAHTETPTRKSKAGVWTGPSGMTPDNLHYNAAAQRLNGALALAAYLEALSDS